MAYTFHLKDAPKINRKINKVQRKNVKFLEPEITKPRLRRLNKRYILEHPDQIKFNMSIYENTPFEARSPSDTLKYFYRWLTLNPDKQLQEKYIKLILVCEAVERAKFTQKRRIKFSVDQHPELLKRPSNKWFFIEYKSKIYCLCLRIDGSSILQRYGQKSFH